MSKPTKLVLNWLFLLFQGFTDDQLMLVEQNTVMVEEREREIRQIVQSISDLNEIFRDLAGMVVEQVFEAVVTCQNKTQYVKMGEVVSKGVLLNFKLKACCLINIQYFVPTIHA